MKKLCKSKKQVYLDDELDRIREKINEIVEVLNKQEKEFWSKCH